MNKIDSGIEEFLMRYPNLLEISKILDDLIHINPEMSLFLIQLAMIYGIHSEVKYHIKFDLRKKMDELHDKATEFPQWK